MEVRAVAKYIRVQPRKVRIVAKEVSGKPAEYSAHLLRYHKSKSAAALRKVLVSAMANARENHGIDPENLRIANIMVDEGPHMKRMIARAMGRGNRIVKKTSHITVVVEEFEAQGAVKAHGTKAKPRPTFAAPKAKGKAKKAEAAPVAEEVAEAAVAEESVAEEAPVEEVAETEVVAEAAPEVVEESPAEAAAEETSGEDAGSEEEKGA